MRPPFLLGERSHTVTGGRAMVKGLQMVGDEACPRQTRGLGDIARSHKDFCT